MTDKTTIAERVLQELGAYLDNEVNNRNLTVSDEREDEWSLDSACFRTEKGDLEILLTNGNLRHGVSIKLSVEADQRLPSKSQ